MEQVRASILAVLVGADASVTRNYKGEHLNRLSDIIKTNGNRITRQHTLSRWILPIVSHLLHRCYGLPCRY
jgi:hypothetical protein